MNKVNQIVICKDKYKTKEDFENAIRDAVMVLLNNNYIMTVRYDEPGLGIVCIDYNSADQSFGDIYPYWLTVEQAESVPDTEEYESSNGDANCNGCIHEERDDGYCLDCNMYNKRVDRREDI